MIPGLIAILGASVLFVDALNTRSSELARVGCLSNERRIATALLLYAQDHDSCLPIPNYQAQNSTGKYWKHWLTSLKPYMAQDQSQICATSEQRFAKERMHGYAFEAHYAINYRFFGVFGAGAFPLDNLELTAQTALITETSAYTYRARPTDPERFVIDSRYFDVSTMPEAYRARHEGRMNVAAADGHVVSLNLRPAHWGGHDQMYGNLAGSIYNWNGGHKNGVLMGAPVD